MKPIPDCVPDALALIIQTARAVSDDDFIHSKVLLKVMGELAEDGIFGANPADIYLQCWEIACRALGVRDPFENDKARGNKAAKGLLRYVDENGLNPESDPLRAAIRFSFAGSMLDYTGLGRGDMQEMIGDYLRTAPARDDTEALLAAIDKAHSVMMVANRAGEIAMDRPLAEAMIAMGKTVYFTVAAKPVYLLATEKDAVGSDFPGSIHIVNPGTAMFGLVQERASSEFRGLLSEVDLVLVKGGTHFSTMTPQRDLFFILMASQEDVAARLEIPTGGGAIVKMPAQGI